MSVISLIKKNWKELGLGILGWGDKNKNDTCASNGNQQPRYEERAGAFVIQISSSENYSKSSVKSSDKILKMIADDPEITISELTAAMELTTRGIEKQMAKLMNEQRVERKGGKKEGSWAVKELFKIRLKCYF